jgi:hypothetical protein
LKLIEEIKNKSIIEDKITMSLKAVTYYQMISQSDDDDEKEKYLDLIMNEFPKERKKIGLKEKDDKLMKLIFRSLLIMKKDKDQINKELKGYRWKDF